MDAPVFLFPPQPPPQPRVALVPGDDPVPSVQARVQNVACPPLCTTLWTALPQRRVVVHRCVHPCGSGVRTCLGPSWFLGKHVAPRCRLRGPQVSALRCSGLLRMPVRASDAIHATPASADSLPWEFHGKPSRLVLGRAFQGSRCTILEGGEFAASGGRAAAPLPGRWYPRGRCPSRGTVPYPSQ